MVLVMVPIHCRDPTNINNESLILSMKLISFMVLMYDCLNRYVSKIGVMYFSILG